MGTKQTLDNLAVVIPAHSDQETLNATLQSFFDNVPTGDYPKALIVVDNNSDPALTLDPSFSDRGIPIELVKESTPGPAAARNRGWRIGADDYESQWTLFVDCGCEFTDNSISGYRDALQEGVAGYQGKIEAKGTDWLSKYYDSADGRGVLSPMGDEETGPDCLITANALVKTEVLQDIGGFNPVFPKAAGEDVDMSIRMKWVHGHRLAFALGARMKHDWLERAGSKVVHGEDLHTLAKRYKRYGEGNALLDHMYPEAMFAPVQELPAGAQELLKKVESLSPHEEVPDTAFTSHELDLVRGAAFHEGFNKKRDELVAQPLWTKSAVRPSQDHAPDLPLR